MISHIIIALIWVLAVAIAFGTGIAQHNQDREAAKLGAFLTLTCAAFAFVMQVMA